MEGIANQTPNNSDSESKSCYLDMLNEELKNYMQKTNFKVR